MKVIFFTIISVKPKIEFSIGVPTFYKGLSISFVFWRKGKGINFTTKKLYDRFKTEDQKIMRMMEKVK